MQLHAKGAHAAMLGANERAQIANRLVSGQESVNAYIQGVCYDAVAYARYLLGAAISPDILVQTSGPDWRTRFRFELGVLWIGQPIPAGTAVGFQRQPDRVVFHAALAVGGRFQIRGINGLLLGAGWTEECSLVPQLIPGMEGWCPFDHTQIRVWLSAL